MRRTCLVCRRAESHCLCAIARNASRIGTDALFAILIHPKEARKTVGTARIVKLCLEEAVLIEGLGPDLDANPRLKALLSDPALDPCVLFPGPSSVPVEVRAKAPGKRPLVLVIDGTWHQAKKMLRTSRLLGGLPRISFESKRSSAYAFRRQPAEHCLSTVEAVHEVITRLEPARDATPLLTVFDALVRQQLDSAAALLEKADETEARPELLHAVDERNEEHGLGRLARNDVVKQAQA